MWETQCKKTKPRFSVASRHRCVPKIGFPAKPRYQHVGDARQKNKTAVLRRKLAPLCAQNWFPGEAENLNMWEMYRKENKTKPRFCVASWHRCVPKMVSRQNKKSKHVGNPRRKTKPRFCMASWHRCVPTIGSPAKPKIKTGGKQTQLEGEKQQHGVLPRKLVSLCT
jgi:hypothetical protein